MLMIDFPFILLFLTLASGLIWFCYYLFFSRKSKPISNEDLPLLVEYAKSLFPIFLIVFILRSFVAQLFIVPSGSLEPTVKPGDYILVTQYNYGLHFPVWNKTLLKTGKPERGDIVVFHWPVNPKVDYIKRVIGIPGDTISYVNKTLFINGIEAKQKFIKNTAYHDPGMPSWQVKKLQEDLLGRKHDIYVCVDDNSGTQCPDSNTNNFYNLKIPSGYYLMMGDNRDDSDDSRYFGLVGEKYLVGKAQWVLLSWNSEGSWIPFHKIRWQRSGQSL